MSNHSHAHDFFWDEGTDPIISVKGHVYRRGEGDEEVEVENAEIRFFYDPFTEIEISMPKHDLKKLVIAATRFLKDGQEACFQKFTDEDTGEVEDNFKVGGFGSELKFPTEKILSRYRF